MVGRRRSDRRVRTGTAGNEEIGHLQSKALAGIQGRGSPGPKRQLSDLEWMQIHPESGFQVWRLRQERSPILDGSTLVPIVCSLWRNIMRSVHRCLFIVALALMTGLLVHPAGASESEGTSQDAGLAVVIDNLEWAIETNGEDIKWPEAVEYCDNLELAGHDDWRLPALEELEGLHDPDASSGYGIRSPFLVEACCLWSGESLVERPADDGDEIAGQPEMYHWGFMFDGGLRYYAVHIFDDGRALCTRDAG